MVKLKYLLFDWGNTVMRDLSLPGPMKDWPFVELIPGAETSLSILSFSYTLIIATSADHSNTEDMIVALQRVGADKFFTHFFSSKELGAKKPDPEFFKKVIRILDCGAGEVISVGDKYPNDIEAAHIAGLKTIWFNENNLQGNFPSANKIILHMEDLPDAVKAIRDNDQ